MGNKPIPKIIIDFPEYKCQLIKTISHHTKDISFIFLLKDKRLASCSKDKTIKIFNPLNNYTCDMTIIGHWGVISSLCQLDNGNLVSCSWDKTIKIWSIKKKSYQCLFTIVKAHDDYVNDVVTISNNRIVSCSRNNLIKIWEGNSPYNKKPLKIIDVHRTYVLSVLYVKTKDLLLSKSTDNKLIIISVKSYQCISIINNIDLIGSSIYPIDNDRVIIGGSFSIYIINLNNMIIESTIKDPKLDFVFSFLKLNDNHILCGCSDGKYCLFNINTQEYHIYKTTCSDGIIGLILINNHTFVSCEFDEKIRVWDFRKI